MEISSIPDYQGGVALNHFLIVFLKCLFKNQTWSEDQVFKWSEDDNESSVSIIDHHPENELSRPTIVVGYPTTVNPIMGFDSNMGMEPSDVGITRSYNFEYSIEFIVRSFTLEETAALADLTFLVLTHPQFCRALEKATHVRPDTREGSFTKSKINVNTATGTVGSSGSFEYEIMIRGKYIVTMNVVLNYIDADTIASEVVSFLRQEE